MSPHELLNLEIFGIPLGWACLGLLVLTVLPAVLRAALGPHEADRAIGADHVFFVLVASLALLSLLWERSLLIDLVIVVTLIGFISALIFGRYLGRTRDAGQPASRGGEPE
ncbi:monovalent cation/H+ antiporter complex subunit F [Nesterenkonia populi]|uniref:monovalent cation/H+ antiporter complex subunit F n=1 Tax=Nesterenkonia populi TaxID=1591087 RepID=UPI0011BE6F4A|nr:monovalent cation/H+ antiporter complex subunit F [Nesterenkonia populi]